MNETRYRRTFSVLTTSRDFMTEVEGMKKPVMMRRFLVAAAAAALLCAMSLGAYAADLGGIQRKIQIFLYGELTDAALVIEDGSYTLNYTTPEGEKAYMSGGGVAFGPGGSERPLTEEEIMEEVTTPRPDVQYQEDGKVIVYYRDQTLDITDRFDEDGICYVELKGGKETWYLTVRYHGGYAASPNHFPRPESWSAEP